MLSSGDFKICEHLQIFESPEKNLIASIIGTAIKVLHSAKITAHNKCIIREDERRDARNFFAGVETSQIQKYCDLLDWDLSRLKVISRDANAAIRVGAQLK